MNTDELSALKLKIDWISFLLQSNIIALDYESILERHYSRLLTTGSVAIDIGAHRGRHLEKFISLVGEKGFCLAFEPLPFAFESLCRKFQSKNIELYNIALSKFRGNSTFTFATGTPEESGLRERIFNDPQNAKPTLINVMVDTLDNYTLNLNKIDFIKIDIEGGEIDCLCGSKNTINTFRPIISVEYGYPSYSTYENKKDTLFYFADSIEYSIFDIFLNELHSIDHWNIACDSIYWDYFMVPREKIQWFKDTIF